MNGRERFPRIFQAGKRSRQGGTSDKGPYVYYRLNPQPSVYTYAPLLPDLRFTPSPLGVRTSKRDSQGLRSQILDDNGNLLSEVDTTMPAYPITKKRYVHAGLDTPLAILDEYNQLYHYLPDGQGSTAMLTDKRGDPVQVYDYEAYGKPNVTATDKNTIKYTGRDYDPDAKLQYNRARYYDPELGRWITPDPLANKVNTDYYSQTNLTLPVNLNKCAYGRCNPVNYTDPLGLHQLLFNGSYLQMFDDSKVKVLQVAATSGLPGYMEPKFQNLPYKGPIPEGEYFLNPKEITIVAGLRKLIRNRFGFWDWGSGRAPLHPKAKTNTFGRSDFFIHGGTRSGSLGCIDIGDKDLLLFDTLKDHIGVVDVDVDYPNFPEVKR